MLRRLTLVTAALCALVAITAAGSAFALTPTSSPLSGSNFQGGDGNQANPGADTSIPPDGVTDIDWQQIAATLPNGTDDPTGGDIAFGGGNKETEPINWDTQNEGVGVDPNKDNILAAWSSSSSDSRFLNLAFTREASTGNTFATFELNQSDQTWDNGHGFITCRKTGDLLISYEVASGGTPPNVDIVVYKWTTVTTDPNGSGCGATGTLTPVDPQPYAQGAVNAADLPENYFTPTVGDSVPEGTFGEASLDLAGVLPKLRLDVCESFSQATMHTRSSTSIDSQLQDLGRTIPVPVIPCKLKLEKKVSVGDSSNIDKDSDVGHVGDTAYYKITVTNTGSQPLDVTTTDVGPTCGGKLFTAPTGGTEVTMPESIAAGASKTYYCSHVITADDRDAGSYENTACTSGTHSTTFTNPTETVTVAAQGDPDEDALCDTATVTVSDPHMAIDKQQALDASGASWTDNDLVAHVGDVVYYKIVASNTGNVPINVTATDVNCGGTVYSSIDQQTAVQFPDQIGVGDDAVYYCRHTLTAADASANHGDYVNTACLTATDTATPPGNATDADGQTETCDDVTTHVVVPGLTIVKQVSATGNTGDFHDSIAVNIGDTAHYRIVVTNTGTANADLHDVNISEKVAVCDAGTISTPAGFTLSGGKLSGSVAQGASVTVTCTHVVKATDPSTIDNIACAKGTDMTGGVIGSGDSICDTARVTVNPPPVLPEPTPEQLVLPERITPGAARLVGATGCQSRAFNARIRGSKIAIVKFVLDGKVVKTVRNTKNASTIAYRINPKKLRLGVHRLVVTVTFQAGSGTQPKTLRLSFQRCGTKLVKPRFTG